MSGTTSAEVRTGNGPAPRNDTLEAARGTASDLRDRARDVAREAGGEAKGAVRDLKAEGEQVLGVARERAEGVVESRKAQGADLVEATARAVRGAASELEEQQPAVARYVNDAARGIDGLARSLRERSASDLMGQVQDLARRQPVAFFGVAVLAGFALARFAQSSARAEPRGEAMRHPGNTQYRSGDPGAWRGEGRNFREQRVEAGTDLVPGPNAPEVNRPAATPTTAATLGGAAARGPAGIGETPGTSQGRH